MAKNPARSGNPAIRAAGAHDGGPGDAGWRDWLHAARLRTLPMAISPVIIGTAAAFNAAGYHLGVSLLCLAVALFLQIGVNFANDYSDGIRGTDAQRVGPGRLTGAGKADPRAVRNVAFAFLALGGVAGLALTILTQHWWFLAVGAVAILAAWFYTGGKRPYGYAGLGELVAFIFFGPVAVLGTVYATLGRVTDDAVVLSIAMGCFSAATMLVNNIRDIDGDRRAGKRTLATLIRRPASKVLFAILLLVPLAIMGVFSLALAYGGLVLIALLVALPAIVIVAMGRSPKDFIIALGLTSITTLLYAIAVGLAFFGGIGGLWATS